jgi:hypothetical protein
MTVPVTSCCRRDWLLPAPEITLNGTGRFAGDAERGFAQPPKGVSREADAEQPQRY